MIAVTKRGAWRLHLENHHSSAALMSTRRIRYVRNRQRLVTVSLTEQEYSWLEEFVAVLETAGYRRARSAVVSAALAELRKSIGKESAGDVLEFWIQRDTKRLMSAIEGNHLKLAKAK